MPGSIADRQMNQISTEELESMIGYGISPVGAGSGSVITSVNIASTGLYHIRVLVRQIGLIGPPDNAFLYHNSNSVIPIPTTPSLSVAPTELSIKKILNEGDTVSIRNNPGLGLTAQLAGWIFCNKIFR